MEELNIGQKVKYHLDDKKWRTGSVHAVRKVDTSSGRQAVIAYLVDTGKDERVDEYSVNKRDVEISKRSAKLHRKYLAGSKPNPEKFFEEVEAISQQDDLPESKVEHHKVRQPEQVEVRPENIKPV